MPVTFPLTALGTVGVSGPPDRVAAHGRWLALQAATLHSPRELILCAAVSRERLPEWDWLKWLPHTHAPGSPLETHLAADQPSTRTLLGELLKLLEERRSEEARFAAAPARQLPSVVLFLDEARVSRAFADRAGLDGRRRTRHLRPLAGQRREGAARRVSGRRSSSIAEVASLDAHRDAERGGRERRDRGRAVRRSSRARPRSRSLPSSTTSAAEGRSRLPREVSLARAARARRRDRAARRRALALARRQAGRRPLGAGADGPFVVDLVRDGPHSLIGGTTGSGKSELLQTLVASLAVDGTPDRLKFLLVDYKGGAAFKECVGLPHTVGFVTDLDAPSDAARSDLAERRAQAARDSAPKPRREGSAGDGAARSGRRARRAS